MSLIRVHLCPSVVNIANRVLNPCFVFRPDIFFKACWRKVRPRPHQCMVKTAWGDWLTVDPRRFIGGNVYMRGVHELRVCELLWRLADPGETVIDVGANIGVMTSLLSRKVGNRGRVFAFEAHPGICQMLERNMRQLNRPQIRVFNRAVSDRAGTLRIQEGEGFCVNEGTARITAASNGGGSFDIESVRLDDVLPQGACGVTKIDVEGHEFEALSGALRCLAERRLRDIVIETTWDFPGRVHELLLTYGYDLKEIHPSLCGPKLLELTPRSGASGRLADYLATLDRGRAGELLGPSGWQVLRREPIN